MDEIKINNTEKSAVDGKWKNPGASLYNELCDASNWKELLEEAYLIAPINDIHNDPRMKTPFSRSGCKYPHHIVKDGKLVLSKSGVRAAYARLKQMGKYSGNAREHIEKHLKELGMIDKDGVHYEDTIQQNFFQIEMYLQEKTGFPFIEDFIQDEYFDEASHGKLEFDYRRTFDAKTHHELLCIYKLKGAQITYPGHAWGVGDYGAIRNKIKEDPSSISGLQQANAEVQKNIRKKGNSDHQSYGQQLITVKDLETGQQWSAYKHVDTDLRKNLEKSKDFGKEFKVTGFFNGNLSNTANAKIFTIKLGEVEAEENKTFKSTKIFKGGMDVLNKAEGRYKYIRGCESDKLYDEWARNEIAIYLRTRVCRQFNSNPFQTSMDAITKWNNNKVPVAINGFSKANSQKPIGSKYKITAKDIEREISKWNERRKSGPLYNAMLKCIDELKKNGLTESTEIDINDLYLFENEIIQYDPPYNADEVIEKYGMDVYNRLAQDPAHKFRMDTGIELIHEEPSLEELNRIHDNWQLMSDQQKEISDKKSIELFGLNNEDHYNQLLFRYNDSREYSIKKANNEYQLISNNGEWISRLRYYIYDDIPNFDWINIADVDTNEKYLRQGYATILLNELIHDIHIQHPTMGLYLLVRAENSPAIKLYEKCGFKILKMQASDNGEFYVMYLGDADINQLKNTNFMTESTDYLEEKSHSKLKYSFRMGINVDTGHLVKIVFDLKPDDVAFVGSHDDTHPVSDDKQEGIIKNIRKTGYTDFVSKAKVLAIVDMDTKERLSKVRASGVMSGLQSFASKPLKEREKMAADPYSKIRSWNWFVVGRREFEDENGNMSRLSKLSDGSYKSTKPANELDDLVKFQNDPLKYGRGYHKESIQESMEWINQFVNNEEFRENAATLANIQSPQSLSKWMSGIKPGYAAKHDNFYHDIDDKNFNPNDQSSLQPPKDIARSKKGSVYDKVELERYWFDNHGYEYAVLCLLMEKDVNDFIIHPFIVYQQGKSIYWFENSLPNVDGSIQFKRLDDLIKCVIKYVRKANDTTTKRIAVYYLSDPPKYGINKREYMRYVQTQIELPLNDLPTKLFSESVEYFEEKSHGNLKYCYRVGFDAATGEQVAIEFNLDSNAITAVSDPRLIDKAKETIAKSGKDISDKTYDDMNANASSELKSKIKKLGHIDFVTSELEVHSIFTKSGKKLNSVNLIPLFSDIVNKSINSLYQSGVMKHGIDSISKVITSKEFVKLLLNKVNYMKYQPEKYEVGKKGGNDKYKSTKLLWDVDMMLSYRYTPILRGMNATGRGVDNADDAMNFIMNDMNNKFKKHKSFEEETIRYTPLDDLILEYSSWGEGYYEANFIGGEKSYQPRDQLTFGNLSIEDIYMGIMYNNPISEECVILDGSSDEYINGLREEAHMLSEFRENVYDSDDEQFIFEAEDNVEEETQEESMPKQTDKKESDKNGVNRKKLYIAFIEWSKTFSDKNAFGSMFDKDAFHVTYPFVPEAMRYFYRIANPLMCILSGNLTFFQLSELRKINAKNSQLANMMIFAATENDMRVFNVKDGAVYMATEENGAIKLGAKLADTFDLYIQTMINRGDILNGADPDKVPDAPPDLSDEEDTSEDNTTEEDIMDEHIEDTQEDNPESSEEPPSLDDDEESK